MQTQAGQEGRDAAAPRSSVLCTGIFLLSFPDPSSPKRAQRKEKGVMGFEHFRNTGKSRSYRIDTERLHTHGPGPLRVRDREYGQGRRGHGIGV